FKSPHHSPVAAQPPAISLRTLWDQQVRGLAVRIYRKEGDQIQIIAFPDEHIQRGDYFLIEDSGLGKGLLVQVIDLQYANVPGILEDILRDVMTDGELAGEDMDPLNISSEVDALKDTRLAVCKIRGTITGERDLSPTTSWLPSRTSSRIRAYPINRLIMNGGKRPLTVGHNDGDPVQIDAGGLDGGLNIITGRKGTGKSHLAKLLLLSMAGLGAPCIVLDVNGEYVNLHKSKDGRLSTSRLQVLLESGLFYDESNPLTEEKILHAIDGGGILVVNLKNQSHTVRRIIVEIFLGELTKILSSNWLRAAFLFAEEAHLYLRDTYWDDIITRMRHIGLFTTFITNQPDTVQETIYRQADNVFIFNFTNEHDIETIGKVAKSDSETIRSLIKGTPARRCLLLGNVVHDLPLMVDVEQLDVRTMGETRMFFS